MRVQPRAAALGGRAREGGSSHILHLLDADERRVRKIINYHRR